MEYIKSGCQYLRKRRDLSVLSKIYWLGPEMTRVPRPYPLTDGKDYLPCDKTPCAEIVSQESPDDYQSRKQLKSQFQEDFISSNKPTSIIRFFQKILGLRDIDERSSC